MLSWGWPLPLSGGPYAPPTLGSSTEEGSSLSGLSVVGAVAAQSPQEPGSVSEVTSCPWEHLWICWFSLRCMSGWLRAQPSPAKPSTAQFSVWGKELGSSGDAGAHTDLPASPGLGHVVLSGGTGLTLHHQGLQRSPRPGTWLRAAPKEQRLTGA